jgi:hypothetical protein
VRASAHRASEVTDLVSMGFLQVRVHSPTCETMTKKAASNLPLLAKDRA